MDRDEPRKLELLRYHRDLVGYLKSEEPEVWGWARSLETRQQQTDEVRKLLLRETYRLEAASHPQVFEAFQAAMAILEIEAPATLYQANDGSMNASLYYIPGEIHLVFFGPVLERLSARELLALMGHELAHYKLWSLDNEDHYNASRVLDNAMSYAEAEPSHRETARLLSLHTELYADRGAAIVAGEIGPAISVLVKVMTGLGTVDPQAYLRQAEELEANATRSEGLSHPETFLRARALDLWWEDSPKLEEWLDQRLRGPISIEALDLLRQRELADMTHGFFARLLKDAQGEMDEVVSQIRRFFPRFKPHDAPLDLARIGPEQIDDSTRGYFISLMFDCAMADLDARDVVLAAAAKTAREIGATDQFKAALKRDLGWTKGQIDRLIANAQKAA